MVLTKVSNLSSPLEDQQRISSFSKLNIRHRKIMDKLEALKVRQ